MSIGIKVLRALHGDCIILTFGAEQDKFIMIDGGIGRECYSSIKEFTRSLKNKSKSIQLLILTHIDSDHINGILKLFSERDFENSIIEKMWFNYGEPLYTELGVMREKETKVLSLHENTNQISWRQGTDLTKVLKEFEFQYEKAIKAMDEFEVEGAHITVLSPSLETLIDFNDQWLLEEEQEVQISARTDYNFSIEALNEMKFTENISLSNKSSIAFLFEYQGRKALLLGDASAIEVETSLMQLGYSEEHQLIVDICKISHHASKHNTSSSLIKILKCRNYIISTNMTASGRPSKECLSRIICNSKQPVKFYCNYEIDYNQIFTKEEFEKYKMQFVTLDRNGMNLEEL